ncbi:hypothetical protein AWC19_00030 [Mycobacterium palustre]|uniref:Glycosyltransferase RgtA/B/C/D-like domain-containing protein n=1 Tax=Mycobacterium palustre TaxID=153971 RepID=A0A1X2A1P5_9MYCO|nr:hypothetical protein AWC19_00030 [Mycobacterium palustre]
MLLLCQAGALATQALAVYTATRGAGAAAAAVSVCGFALAFASALWTLTQPQLSRALRNTAVMCLAVTPAVLRWLPSPRLFSDFDEQLHMRTLRDIVVSHSLFQSHPLLSISPRYPGLEAVATLFHQLGLPVMVAAMVVVLLARLALVSVLCDAVEHLTGSLRAGGLAVAVYAVSAQFVAFDSQFASQTLALPPALAAVALIARARWAADPRVLFGGAGLCLLAVAMTDYVTSWLAAAALVFWCIAQRGRQARRRVFCGAVVAVAVITVWAIIQWSVLGSYFGPIIGDLASQLSGQPRRGAFSDAAGYSAPPWERFLLVYWAAAVVFVVALLILICVRSVLPRLRSGAPPTAAHSREPRVLLAVLVAMNPVLMALPAWGSEAGDRVGALLFLPLSLLAATAAERRSQLRRGSNFQPWSHRQLTIARSVAVVLATGAFAGGYLMGSGPGYNRLSGPYLVAADGRSMDGETLAAVRWAGDQLPPGSRIGADRMSGALLASQAGLWPVLREGEVGVPGLYLGDGWNPWQSEVARDLRLRYLYVDQRLADGPPHLGWYFYPGETEELVRFTQDQLTRFDNLSGIDLLYRHGPVSIYDLGGLGVPELRSGWRGGTRDPGAPIQIAIGLLFGLALALAARSRARYTVTQKVEAFRLAAGPPLTFAAGLAAVCAGSVTLLLAHVWLGPFVFLSMALGALLVNLRWARSVSMSGTAALRSSSSAALEIPVVLAAAAVTRSALVRMPKKSLIVIGLVIFLLILFIALGVYDGIEMQRPPAQSLPTAGHLL